MKIHGSIEGPQGWGRRAPSILRFHEWKFMALLKEIIPQEIPRHQHKFPWMKIHGSIEVLPTELSCTHGSSFHEWKFMALLKPLPRLPLKTTLCLVSMNENSWLYWSISPDASNLNVTFSFHEWKFMALLKHSLLRLPSLPCTVFPWMKIHGSIEAWQIRWAYYHDTGVSMNENSWLYWSLTIFMAQAVGYIVSMNENSWLYWSCRKPKRNSVPLQRFHEWKFMALLKLLWDPNKWHRCNKVSMNENSWLYWSPEISHRIDEELLKFPWMKIHGSIEAGT